MKIEPRNFKIIIFEDILREFSFDDKSAPLAKQIQVIIDKTGVKLISIGDIVMKAEELIYKVKKIESALVNLWYECDLPELQFTTKDKPNE